MRSRLGTIRASSGLAVPRAAPSDGRKQRSFATQRRIVEALLGLVTEGNLTPHAEQVSERAGVGLRTVFRHFKDMESLYARASALLTGELERVARAPFAATDWRGQIFEMVARRGAVYERLAPLVQAAQVHRSRSAVLQTAHMSFVALLRQILLDKILSDPGGRALPSEVVEALDLLLSFEAWHRLRYEQRLSSEETQRVLRASLAAVLAHPQPPPDRSVVA